MVWFHGREIPGPPGMPPITTATMATTSTTAAMAPLMKGRTRGWFLTANPIPRAGY